MFIILELKIKFFKKKMLSPGVEKQYFMKNLMSISFDNVTCRPTDENKEAKCEKNMSTFSSHLPSVQLCAHPRHTKIK